MCGTIPPHPTVHHFMNIPTAQLQFLLSVDWPQFCITVHYTVTVKDNNTYLNICTAKFLNPVLISFKWDSVQLLHRDTVLLQDPAKSWYADLIDILKCPLVSQDFSSELVETDSIVGSNYVYYWHLLLKAEDASTPTPIWSSGHSIEICRQVSWIGLLLFTVYSSYCVILHCTVLTVTLLTVTVLYCTVQL